MSWNFPFYDGEWKSFVEGRINFLKGEAERIWKRMPEVAQQYPGAGANLNGFGIPGSNNDGGNSTRFWRIGIASQDISSGSAGNWQYGIGTQGVETGDGTDRVGYFYSLNQRGFIKSGDRIQAFWNGSAWEIQPCYFTGFLIGKTAETARVGSKYPVQLYHKVPGADSFVSEGETVEAWFLCGNVQSGRWVHLSYCPLSRAWFAVAGQCN